MSTRSRTPRVIAKTAASSAPRTVFVEEADAAVADLADGQRVVRIEVLPMTGRSPTTPPQRKSYSIGSMIPGRL